MSDDVTGLDLDAIELLNAVKCLDRDEAGNYRCDQPAVAIPWGTLYAKDQVGPKCADHLRERHPDLGALIPGPLSGPAAIVYLYPLRAALAARPAGGEGLLVSTSRTPIEVGEVIATGEVYAALYPRSRKEELLQNTGDPVTIRPEHVVKCYRLTTPPAPVEGDAVEALRVAYNLRVEECRRYAAEQGRLIFERDEARVALAARAGDDAVPVDVVAEAVAAERERIARAIKARVPDYLLRRQDVMDAYNHAARVARTPVEVDRG